MDRSELCHQPVLGSARSGLIILLLTAAVLRLAIMLPPARRGLDDPDNYLPLARSLAEGQGLALNGHPTAYRPPLYPVVLLPVEALPVSQVVWGIVGLHLALGLGTVWLITVAATRWRMTRPACLLAGFIVAVDPVLVVQGRSVMTETLAAFLLAGALAGLASDGWRGPVMGGVWLGLAALCRPSLLAGGGLVAMGALLVVPGGLRTRFVRACVLAGTMTAVLLPWAMRNALVLGEPIWTTTHGGYTLALANNATYYADVLDRPDGGVWSGANQRRWFDWVNDATRGMTEPQSDRFLRSQTWGFIAGHRAAFARAALARLGRFWGLAPSGAVYPLWLRVATALWTAPLWILLVAGLVRRSLWRWPMIAAPLVLIGLSAVHAFYWTDLRMRAPIVPAIALVAAWGLGALRTIARANGNETFARGTAENAGGVTEQASEKDSRP